MAKRISDGQRKYRQSLVRRELRQLLIDEKFLHEVLTLPEVMQMYNKSRASVLGAIDTARLTARKAEPTPASKGGAWLILKSSADMLWKEVKS